MTKILGIKNVCPNDESIDKTIENNSIIVEQCLDTCAIGYWCNNIGLADLGGICCPLKSRSQLIEINAEKKLIKCPKKNILSLSIENSQNNFCKLHCHTNKDCNINHLSNSHICCFNGCGTICILVENGITNCILV